MAWAFWLLLSLLGLYIFFGGKRRQRVVEAVEPNNNTTVAFTETIGRLYLQKKDNRNIADKQITYLLEHIRNQYYLNTSQVNDEFIAALSRKTNASKEGMDKLFQMIHTVQQSEEISDDQLLGTEQPG
jgi:predicted nucleic acid-binding protein